MFNGEIWGFCERQLSHLIKTYRLVFDIDFFKKLKNFDFTSNDTRQIFEYLCLIDQFHTKQNFDLKNAISHFLNVFDADFSLVFFIQSKNLLFVSKDFFGKKSLLFSCTDNGFIFHSTGSTSNHLNENLKHEIIPAINLKRNLLDCKSSYYSQLMNGKKSLEIVNNSLFLIDFNSLEFTHRLLNESSHHDSKFKNLFIDLHFDSADHSRKLVVDSIFNILNESVRSMITDRINDSISILFSGGLDSCLLAYFTLLNFSVL
jgi:asparagine synthetase B (glutamine-hydrolysing)